MAEVKSEVQEPTLAAPSDRTKTSARDSTTRDPRIHTSQASQLVQPWIRTKARGEVQCKRCREWFGNDELARSEVHKCSGAPMNDLVSCQYCEKPWTTEEEHADHEKVCPARPGEARQLAQCAQCKSWVVNNKGTKGRHINRCTGGNANHRNNCPTCAGTFARPRQKELHISNGCPGLHPEAITFFDTISCDRCWKEFEMLTEYREHEERQHLENEKDAFKCKLCGRGFPTKHSRDNLHMTTCGVPWRDRNKHRCAKCDQAFSNPYKRNEHQKDCKPFRCEKCRKAFEWPQERDQHQAFCNHDPFGNMNNGALRQSLSKNDLSPSPHTCSDRAQPASAGPAFGEHARNSTTDIGLEPKTREFVWNSNYAILGASVQGAFLETPRPPQKGLLGDYEVVLQLTDKERALKRKVSSVANKVTPSSYPSSQENDRGREESHRGLPATVIYDRPLSTLPSSKEEMSRRIAQTLLDHRLNRGGDLGRNTGGHGVSNEVSPERFLIIFAQAASEVLTTYEIDRLVASFQHIRETQNNAAHLHQSVDQRVQRFYREEVSLSGSSQERLAAPSGPPDAELGLLMHCQTKDGQIGAFWDDQNQSISALQQKGLSPEFAFGFDLHWRAGLPGRQNKGCPAVKWPPAVRRLHDDLTSDLLKQLPFHLLLVAGSCPTKFHRRATGVDRLLQISIAPSLEVDMVLEVRPGGSCRITTYIPHPAHVLYNKSTSSESCAILDSVISFYLWLLNRNYSRGTFAKLAEEISSGVPNGAPFHRLSAYRKKEKSLDRILQEHEYERSFWLWAGRCIEARRVNGRGC